MSTPTVLNAYEVCDNTPNTIECVEGDRMNTISNEVGKRIREYRHQAGLSLEVLALNAGITPNFLGDVERGVKKPSLETLECLLTSLNLTFEEFFNFKTDLKPCVNRSKSDKIMADISCFSDKELEIVHNIVRQLMKLKNT